MKSSFIFIVVSAISLGVVSVLPLKTELESDHDSDSNHERANSNSSSKKDKCQEICTLEFSPVCAKLLNGTNVEYPNYCTFEAEQCLHPLQPMGIECEIRIPIGTRYLYILVIC
jgi:hypothetical protein